MVPDLKGLTLDQAKERLEKLDLALGAVEMVVTNPSRPKSLSLRARSLSRK